MDFIRKYLKIATILLFLMPFIISCEDEEAEPANQLPANGQNNNANDTTKVGDTVLISLNYISKNVDTIFKSGCPSQTQTASTDSTTKSDTVFCAGIATNVDTIKSIDTLFIKEILEIRECKEKFIGLDINQNTTWYKDTIYILTSRVKVRPGVELNIQAGTVIKGAPGQGANAKVLMIMRGGKIHADGTANEPIIFTSTLDSLRPGDLVSPNLPNDLSGLWGGIAILGNGIIASPIRDMSNAFDIDQIEGVPSSDRDGLYGGNDNNDNSGRLKYVSIRHSGTSIGSGNEINALSLAGVGSMTQVENIEIVATSDDGVELYGGKVDITNLVVWNNGDDAIDTDQGYIGTINNSVLIGAGGDPFELDGPEGATTSINSNFNIINSSVITSRPNGTNSDGLIDYDNNTNGSLSNVFFTNVVQGQKVNSNDRTSAPMMSFQNIIINVSASDLPNYISIADPTVAPNVSSGAIPQANTTPFASWTWTEKSGAMTGL